MLKVIGNITMVPVGNKSDMVLSMAKAFASENGATPVIVVHNSWAFSAYLDELKHDGGHEGRLQVGVYTIAQLMESELARAATNQSKVVILDELPVESRDVFFNEFINGSDLDIILVDSDIDPALK